MLAKDIFERLGFLPDLYLVGGAVRDLLFGFEPDDLDFATSLEPNAILEECKKMGIEAIPTGIAHGTITVVIDRTPYEITTFRTDFEHDGRRSKVTWGKSIGEDLARRDFTIGAIAMDSKGKVIDPFGGKADFRKKIIRAVGDPHLRFAEDYLRVVRAGRFAGRYEFEIEKKTLEAAYEAAPKVLGHVAIERLTGEISKAFQDSVPSHFLRYLFNLGLLQEILPEMAGCDVLYQNPEWHPEGDVFTHVLEVVDRSKPQYRWHALLHDIGKKKTAVLKPEGYFSFHGHESVGAEMISGIAEKLRLSGNLRDEIVVTTKLHMTPLHLKDSLTPRNIRKFQAIAGEYLQAVKEVCDADGWGRRDPRCEILFEPQPIPVEPILKGRHLIERGHQAGTEFSRLLQRAFEYQLEEGETDLERLYRAAKG